MSIIPTMTAPSLVWVKVAAMALLAGFLFVGGARFEHGRMQARIDAEKAAQVAQDLAESQEARRRESARARNVQQEQDHARQIAAAAQRDAGAARTELGRLRDELAARDRIVATAASAKCVIDVGAAERKLLGACAEEYQRMAESADGIRAQLIELQGWTRAVTAKP